MLNYKHRNMVARTVRWWYMPRTQHFPTFVKTKCTASLIGLLAHENMDISSDVVDLFHEMTDAEDAAPEDLQSLVDVLLEMDAAPMLMSHMEKLNEANEDEAACIHSTLGIFESILEARRAPGRRAHPL